MNEGTDLHTLADVEESDALRAVQLVSAGAEHVDVILVYIDRQLAVCLHGIGVEQNAMLLCDLSDLFDRLNRSDLIVCKHHRNQDRIRADRSFQLVDLYLAVLIDINIGNLIAPLLEIFARMQDRMVLDLCRDDMLSFGFISLCRRLQCPVIRLRTAGGKVNLLRLCAKRRCDRLTAFIDRFLTLCSDTVNAGCVSVVFGKIRKHGLYNSLRGLGRCCIIKINQFSHSFILLLSKSRSHQPEQLFLL